MLVSVLASCGSKEGGSTTVATDANGNPIVGPDRDVLEVEGQESGSGSGGNNGGNSNNKNPNVNVEALPESSGGLRLELNYDKAGYTVLGIGDYPGADVVIGKYNGLPVTAIGDKAFADNAGIKSVTLSEGLIRIGEQAFGNCTGLTEITIPESVVTIGVSAFCGCAGIKSIVIPNNVTDVGAYAFDSCTGLTGVTLGSSVSNIGVGAFGNCVSLAEIKVAEGNTTYRGSGNCIVDIAEKTLVVGCKTTVIPADGSVEIIGESAFSKCTGLAEIVIPDGVLEIKNNAFYGCDALKTVTISKQVTGIGEYVFFECKSLATVNYNGNKVLWQEISKGYNWDLFAGNYVVKCADGPIEG